MHIIFIIIFSISLVNASDFSYEISEGHKKLSLLKGIASSQKNTRIFLEKIEKFNVFDLHENILSQRMIIDYFYYKIKTGLVPFSMQENNFIRNCSLEKWSYFLDNYDDIFAILCVIKKHQNLEWSFPETLKEKILSQATHQGNSNAQYTLGLIYELGVIQDKDCEKALYWYTRPTCLEHTGAKKNVGDIFWLQKNYYKAFYWYHLAASQGHARAQYNLGRMYQDGIGVPLNYREGFYWILCAAFQGLSDAQYLLGFLHQKETSITRDYSQAIYWYHLAAQQVHIEAQYTLGLLFLTNLNSPPNYDQAMKWLLAAAQNGCSLSQGTIKNLFIKKKENLPLLEQAVSSQLKSFQVNNESIRQSTIQLFNIFKDLENFNNFQQNLTQKETYGIPLLYNHYKRICQFLEKSLMILDDLENIGYLVDRWGLKSVDYLTSYRDDKHTYEEYYFQKNIYFCLGKENVRKGTLLMSILKGEDQDLKLVIESCDFLKKIFTSKNKSLFGKVIEFQNLLKSGKRVNLKKFKSSLFSIEENPENALLDHPQGKKVHFKGIEKHIRKLDTVKNLPNHLKRLFEQGTIHRNSLFINEFPYLN